MRAALLILCLALVSLAQKDTATLPRCGTPEAKDGNTCYEDSAILIDGKCSICVKEGQKSTVTMDSFGSCTLMACSPGHYDEDGKWVAPLPCNTCSRVGRCSRGHRVAETWKQ